MNKFINLILSFLVVLLFACNSGNPYAPENNDFDCASMMDTILPYFAKLHDTIPANKKFSPVYKNYFDQHKKEREYQCLYYAPNKDAYHYFMVYRLEPAIKKDKYIGICGRYKRDTNGAIDLASYEELFWTWKMKKEELFKKSRILFNTILKEGSIEKYKPENSDGFWIEFPGNGVVYDKNEKAWVKKVDQ